MGIMRLGAVALAVLALSAVLAASSAAAEENQPWCAVYPTDMGRTTQCSFATHEQCLAAVSGIGSCQRNRSAAPRGDRRQRRH